MFGSIRVGCDHTAITVWLKRCDSIEEKGRAVEFESHARVSNRRTNQRAGWRVARGGFGDVAIAVQLRPRYGEVTERRTAALAGRLL
jgi:hypothetical protein